MHYVYCLSVLLVSVQGYPSVDVDTSFSQSDGAEREELVKTYPRIKSKPSTLAAAERETVTFPCEVEDLGSLQVYWGSQKGSRSAQLFLGPIRLTQDDRINLDGTNLVIKDVNQSDSGIYICKVSVDKEISVNHTFFVSGPPSITKDPLDGKVILTKGQTLKLTCKPSTTPKPDIKWEKLDTPMSSKFISEQETLTIPSVGRQDAGKYRCSAISFIGSSNHADFEVIVEEPPELELPEPNVYTGIGQEVKLRCMIYGNPVPIVKWEKLDTGSVFESRTRNNETTMSLRVNGERDFGKYRCSGVNRFGKTNADIEVSGRPSKPVILNTDNDFPTSGDEFELKYQVTSYAPITKIIVTYRVSKDMESFSDWNTTEIEANDTNGPAYNLRYNFHNMDRNTYEVKVYAENKYGRSEGSEIYSITADGAIEHWKAAGSSSYGLKSSPIQIITCLVLLITSCLARI